MSDNNSKLISVFRTESAQVEGDYSFLLRGMPKNKNARTAFSSPGDGVEVGTDDTRTGDQRETAVRITFSCRAQNPRVDQIDTGTRINDRIIYNYRLSFIGSNHKLLNGDQELYQKLPASVPIELNLPSQPLTQWDGEDVEVSGTTYERGGTFDADSVIIPKLGGFRIVEPKSGYWGFLFIFVIIVVVAVFIFANAE